MKRIFALALMIFIIGCAWNLDKLKIDKEKGTLEVEKIETKK